MCGRFVSASSPQLLAEHFGVQEIAVPEHEPDYNVTPRALVPVVRERRASEDDEPRRVLSLVRWGLVPSWAESPAIGDRLINARADTVRDKPSYREAFRKRRCIVPADAFYEWHPRPKGAPRAVRDQPRQPFLVHRRDGEPLAFAGLWEIWRDPDPPAGSDGWLRSCAIVTTDANELLSPIHARMPVVLDDRDWEAWLDPANRDLDGLSRMLRPAPDSWLGVYPVSPRVNSPKHNDPSLLDRVDA